MDDSYALYSVVVSSRSSGSNLELLTINNNSPSAIFIDSIRYRTVVLSANTALTECIEGFRLSASSTGGTNQASAVIPWDTNTPALDPLINITGDSQSILTSGVPLVGGCFWQSTAWPQFEHRLYEYRNGGIQKPLRIGPNEYFGITRGPLTSGPTTGFKGVRVVFAVVPSSTQEVSKVFEDPTRNTYSFNLSSVTASGTSAGGDCYLAINNNSASTLRFNVVKYRHSASASITALVNNVVEGYRLSASTAGGEDRTVRYSKFDTSSPNLDPAVTFIYGPSSYTIADPNNPIMGGAWHPDRRPEPDSEYMYKYRGALNQKQCTLRPGDCFAFVRAPGTLTLGGGANVDVPMSLYLEFTMSPT